MRKFDYSFLSNGLLPAKLINLTSGIASLKTMAGVRKEEYAKDGALSSDIRKRGKAEQKNFYPHRKPCYLF